ncbi:MAG: endonuclease/exonuclease/phosphatase family protein [Agriterribacter sp.]
MKFRKFTKRFIIVIYVCVAVAFLTACLSPFLNPSNWWFFGFLGLLFPYLLVILFFFLIFWIVTKSKWSLLAIFCLLVGWKSILAVFAFHPGKSFSQEKREAGSLRVMTWNVRSFMSQEDRFKKMGLTLHQQAMMDLIQTYNPDVLAIQEFFTADSGRYFNNIWHFTRHMDYPYYYFSKDVMRQSHVYTGTVIFSRFPIIDTGKFSLEQDKKDNTESLIFADVVHGKDTVKIYTAHLQSFGFMQRDYKDISKIKNDPDERIDASKNILRKMKNAFQRRGLQADFISNKLNESTYPEIFCGDLNDVPNSYTYFTVRGDKGDAFIAGNFGFGQTFYSFSSGFMRDLATLRIDYIFTDPRFRIIQSRRIPHVLSDHFPVVADIQLPAK